MLCPYDVSRARSVGGCDLDLITGDELIGSQIIRKACEAPLRQLVDNAGIEGAVVVEEVKKAKGSNGYDVASNTYVDMVKVGIIDPTKVTRSALQNAASIAGLFLTTEVVVADKPEKAAPAADPTGGMGGMDF